MGIMKESKGNYSGIKFHDQGIRAIILAFSDNSSDIEVKTPICAVKGLMPNRIPKNDKASQHLCFQFSCV